MISFMTMTCTARRILHRGLESTVCPHLSTFTLQEKYDVISAGKSALALNLSAPALPPSGSLGDVYYNRNFTKDERW